MDPEKFQQVAQIFEEIVDLEGDARQRALYERCGDDADLRREVESLLGASPEEGRSIGAVVEQAKENSAFETRGLEELGPGSELGPYTILRRLGEGGMGEVYEARQEQPLKRSVALKVIRWGMASPQAVARFESERQALALMDHGAIAKVFDAGTSPDGRPYFAMELVEGEPIDRFCDRLQLDLEARLELFRQVCRGVQHAHQRGIIHRDLKPSNVLVAEQDGAALAKVIDFGIAKATSERLTEETLQTRFGQILGTPEYMSPEQADSEGTDVDTRSDVYSLGVLLYELVTGTSPIDLAAQRESGVSAMLHSIRHTDPEIPSRRVTGTTANAEAVARSRSTTLAALARRLKGDLDWVVMKAIAKERERRYSTAGDLADEVDRYLANVPVLAGPEDPIYRLRKFVQRNRLATTAAALVAMSLLLGSALAVAGLLRARAAEAEALGQAAAANEVVDFLTGLFEAADPVEEARASVTAQQLLETGAASIEGRFEDQPVAKAKLLTTMGSVFLSMGLGEQAQGQLEEALALAESPGSPVAAEERAETQLRLAQLRERAGDIAAAEELARRALEIRQRELGERAQTGAAWDVLGKTLIAKGDLEGAESAFREALRIAEKMIPGTEDHALWQYDLAGVYYFSGRPAEAVPLLDSAIEILERQAEEGRENPRLGSILRGAGTIQSELGNSEKGLELMQRSVAIDRAIYGDRHPRIGDSVMNLGILLKRLGREEEALGAFEEATGILEEAYGADSIRLANAVTGMGGAFFELGRFVEARRAYERGDRIRRANLPEDHLDRLLDAQGLALIEMNVGDLEVARRLYEEVVQFRLPLLGETNPESWVILANLAEVAHREGNNEEAIGYLRRINAAAEGALVHHRPAPQVRRLVGLLRDSGDAEFADEIEAAMEATGEAL